MTGPWRTERMGVGRAIVALLWCAVVLSVAGGVRAQRVALVRPADDDAVLIDAFNRLHAELRIHAFEPLVLEATTTTRDPDGLAMAAQRADALACIAFVRHDGKTAVEVWLADRVSGKITMRTLELSHTSDASSVLAIRAVDLLRASLRELDLVERPPPEVVGVDPRPVPEAVQALTAAPEPLWSLRAEGTLVLDRPALGPAFGPSLGVTRRLSDRIDLGLTVAGPLLFGSWKTNEGAASVRQQLAWAEVRMHAFHSRALKLGANLALGEHYLYAQGQARSPLMSRTDDVWSFLFGFGLHAQWNMVTRVAVILSVRGLILTPRPGVGIGQRSSALALPVLYAATGIMLGF